MKKISIVTPTYHSESFIQKTLDAVAEFAQECKYDIEYILVDDGSSDGTFNFIVEYSEKCNLSVKALQLFTNRGQFHALMAGFNVADGDYIVTLDDDLEYPPSEIEKLVEIMDAAEGEVDVVIGLPQERKKNPFRRFGTWLTNKTNTIVFKKPEHIRSGSFRLLTQDYVKKLTEYKTANPVLGPLIFRSTRRIRNVVVNHSKGIRKSNYGIFSLLDTFVRNFQNFTELPFRYIASMGLLIAICAFLFALFVIFQYFTGFPYPIKAAGWTSLIVSIWLLSGIIFFGIGLIGQYIFRILEEVSRYPNFQVRQIYKNNKRDL